MGFCQEPIPVPSPVESPESATWRSHGNSWEAELKRAELFLKRFPTIQFNTNVSWAQQISSKYRTAKCGLQYQEISTCKYDEVSRYVKLKPWMLITYYSKRWIEKQWHLRLVSTFRQTVRISTHSYFYYKRSFSLVKRLVENLFLFPWLIIMKPLEGPCLNKVKDGQMIRASTDEQRNEVGRIHLWWLRISVENCPEQSTFATLIIGGWTMILSIFRWMIFLISVWLPFWFERYARLMSWLMSFFYTG